MKTPIIYGMEAKLVSATLSRLTPNSLTEFFNGLRLPKTASEIPESLAGMSHHLDELTHERFPERATHLERKLAGTLSGYDVSFRNIVGPRSGEFPSAKRLSVSTPDIKMTISRFGDGMSLSLQSLNDRTMTLASNAFYLSGSGREQILVHQPTEFDRARELGMLVLSH